MRPPIQRLHERHREFGHGLGTVAGDIAYREAEFLSGGEVDVVVPRAAEEDGADSEGVQLGEDRGCEEVVDEDADGGVCGGERDGGGEEWGGVVGYVEGGIGAVEGGEVGGEEAPIVGLGGEDGEGVRW